MDSIQKQIKSNLYKLEVIYKSKASMYVENINEDRLEFFLDNLVLNSNVTKVIVTKMGG